MKTTIYDLLGMIKNDKLVKRILFRNQVYEYEEDGKDYYNEEYGWIFDEYDLISILNEPVEILETTITYKQDEPTFKKIDGEWYVRTDFRPDGNIVFVEKAKQDYKIEKLEIDALGMLKDKNNSHIISIIDIVDKINEIIDKLNKE